MSTLARALMLLGLLGVTAAVGCNEQNEGMGGDDQQAMSAEEQIAQLEAELDEAARMRAADQNRIAALEAERNRLQDEMDQLATIQDGSEWRSVPGGAMTAIESQILFDSGKAGLRPGAQEVLDVVARTIVDQYGGYDVYVFGNTDNEPIKVSGWDDNYELSCQRALTVVRYLQSRGCPDTMMAGGWGQNMPVADNSTSEGRQMNRRVEIYAIKPVNPVTGSVSNFP